jgi:hypothetical protein
MKRRPRHIREGRTPRWKRKQWQLQCRRMLRSFWKVGEALQRLAEGVRVASESVGHFNDVVKRLTIP